MDTEDLRIALDGIELAGTLVVPEHAIGLVIFAHGSGSNQHSPRNQRVAQILQSRGLATLLFDMQTAAEEEFDAVEMTLHSDVDTLAERLCAATDSVIASGKTRELPIAYFGGTTGAAAALIAATRRPGRIVAIVSRGGRTELAARVLEQVTAPTLLIVGGEDTGLLEVNRQTAAKLGAPHRVEVIPHATHLFEEPGALDQVGRLAAAWFIEHFARVAPAAQREAHESPRPTGETQGMRGGA